LQLRFDEVEMASAYEFLGCSTRNFVFDPGIASLAISEECANRSETRILGFAHDFGSDVYAYAGKTLGPESLGDDIDLVWKTDFVEHSIALELPAGTTSVRTSPFLELDGRLIDSMVAETELDAMAVKTPSFVTALDRIRVEASIGPAISSYLGRSDTGGVLASLAERF
jgi:hypothetical protein